MASTRLSRLRRCHPVRLAAPSTGRVRPSPAYRRPTAEWWLAACEPVARRFSASARALEAVSSPTGAAPAEKMQIQPKMRIEFTCTARGKPAQPDTGEAATACGHRNAHEFSKLAYEKGIVLVQCPECKNRHLIGPSLGPGFDRFCMRTHTSSAADHLQWFTGNKTASDPNFRNDHRDIVDVLAARGEKVRRGRTADADGGVIEYYE